MQNPEFQSPALVSSQSSTETARRLWLAFVFLSNASLYYFVTTAGAPSVEKTFHLHEKILIQALSGLAALNYAAFVLKNFKTLQLRFIWKEKTPLQRTALLSFVLLGFFASLNAFSGAYRGELDLGISKEGSAFPAFFLYVFRVLTCWDNALKLPQNLQKIEKARKEAVNYPSFWQWNYRELSRLFLALAGAAFLSVSVSNGIYNAVAYCFSIFNQAAPVPMSYAFAALGSVGTFPLALNGIYKGLLMLTTSVNTPEEPQSRTQFAYAVKVVGFLLSIPGILGSTGASLSANYAAITQGLFRMTEDASRTFNVAAACLYAITSSSFGMIPLVNLVWEGVSRRWLRGRDADARRLVELPEVTVAVKALRT